MGKRTALHEAAERGDSDRLQHLLDEGIYDVNEANEQPDEREQIGVCVQTEKA